MNWRAVWTIVRKDLRVVSRSKAVLLPLIIVPVVLMILLPGISVLAPEAINMGGATVSSMDDFMNNLPSGLQAELAGYNEDQQWIVVSVVYLFAPMYLIAPLMVANVIAADSFAGEKDRKTLEPLLHTPITDGELFLGKVLSAWLPALGVSLLGAILYGVVANLAAWPAMGRIFFPNGMWVILVVWVAPAAAGLGLSSMVLVSARVRGFQEAYQLGGIVVLPLVLLVIGQAAGVMYFSQGLVLLLGLVLWAIDAGLLWLGVRLFQRDTVLSRR